MLSKEAVKDCVPPKLWRGLKRLMREEKTFSGNFSTWQEAKRACGSGSAYESDDCVRRAIALALEGQISSQTGVLKTMDMRLLAAIEFCLIQLKTKEKVSVIDFGGGAGAHYFRFQPFIGDRISTWTVVELPELVAASRERFQRDGLVFEPSLKNCAPADIVLTSCAVQYIPNFVEVFSELFLRALEYVIFDRLPLLEHSSDRITVQQVPKSTYAASYPAYFFSSSRFVSRVEEHAGRAKLRWSVPEDESWLDGKKVFYSGMLIEKSPPKS